MGEANSNNISSPVKKTAYNSLLREHPGVVLTFAYGVLSLIGLVLETIFLAHFDIFIIHYAEITDFLLSPLKLLPSVISLVLLSLLYFGIAAIVVVVSFMIQLFRGFWASYYDKDRLSADPAKWQKVSKKTFDLTRKKLVPTPRLRCAPFDLEKKRKFRNLSRH